MTKSKSLIKQVNMNAHKQVLSTEFEHASVVYDEIKGNPYYRLNFCYTDNGDNLKHIEVFVNYRKKPIMFIMPEFIKNFLSNKKNLSKNAKHKIVFWGNEKSAGQKEIKQLMVLNMYNCGIL